MARPFCKHYRGMYKETQCLAGVAFADLPNAGTKLFSSTCPCFGEENADNCDLSEYPTAEEMAAEDRELAERFANIGRAREAIVTHIGGPWKRGMSGTSGQIDCPVCDGNETLRFSRSGYNGHIHARCETEGCVAWME